MRAALNICFLFLVLPLAETVEFEYDLDSSCNFVSEYTSEFLYRQPELIGMKACELHRVESVAGRRWEINVFQGERERWTANVNPIHTPPWTEVQEDEHPSYSLVNTRCAEGQESTCQLPPANRFRVNVLIDVGVDEGLVHRLRGTGNPLVVLLFEPRNLCKICYSRVLALNSSFDLVFTHDDELLEELGSKGRFTGTGLTMIPVLLYGLHTQRKTKLVCTVLSNKNFLPGHVLRSEVVQHLGSKIGHIYGESFWKLEEKADSCLDYMFQVVIENNQKDCYITEKLIDCLLTGVIPIYWGCERVGDLFDSGGILQWDGMFELEKILDALSPEFYISLLPAVHRNYELALHVYKAWKPFQLMWQFGLADLVRNYSQNLLASTDEEDDWTTE